ncbi:MAG: putative lipid II flippase FtsW [Parcubacteria group bacterium]|nr:putative lipid II flippase FtsW [Parcubacteria group bacterium]
MGRVKKIFSGDLFLLLCSAALVVFGFIVLWSASSVISQHRFGVGFYYINRQLIAVGVGMVAFIITAIIDVRFIRRYSWLFFIGAVALLSFVFIPGLGIARGSALRWIHIGPFSMQPSEIAKLFFILYGTAWCAKLRDQNRISAVGYSFIPFLIIIGGISLLIIAEPDFGTAMIFIAIAFGIYFIAGARFSFFIALAFLSIALMTVVIAFSPYRVARVLTFLNPQFDPKGIGYHVDQITIAVESGGWLGKGLGSSAQKYLYVPEILSDSIFAIVAEEMGFIVSGMVIALFFLLAWRIFYIAARATNSFEQLLASGIGIWFIGQTAINIAAILTLVPLTGIPLPLVSYGGTAFVSMCAGLGLVYNISKNDR